MKPDNSPQIPASKHLAEHAEEGWPLSGFARRYRAIRRGPTAVDYRILETLQVLICATKRGRVHMRPEGVVWATKERFPKYPRPTVGETFDALGLWQHRHELRVRTDADAQMVISLGDNQDG